MQLKKVWFEKLAMTGIMKLFKYPNKCIAIRFDDIVTSEPICMLTINLPDAITAPDEFCVKGWSENELIIEDCRKSGLFEDTGKRGPAGYATAEIWKFK